MEAELNLLLIKVFRKFLEGNCWNCYSLIDYAQNSFTDKCFGTLKQYSETLQSIGNSVIKRGST